MDNLDISTEIDRILSSNIKEELLNQIPLQLLQTPTIQKKNARDEMSSAKSKQSFSRQNLQQDLYEKAEQIIKLKQTLQAELSKINQIVQDNQKLTEANLYLRQELKKIKAQWKSFQTSVTNDLNQQKQIILRMKAQFSQTLQLAHKKKQSQKLKMSIFSVFSIKKGNDSLVHKEKYQNKNCQISSQQFVQNFYFGKTHKKSIESQTQLNAKNYRYEIDQLKDKMQTLYKENNALKGQIKILKKTQMTIENPIQKIEKQSRNENKTAIECYTSVFLKSVFSQPENSDQIIQSILFSQQKTFFKQLKQSKYFGKMILGNKNGNGFQQYKNGFNYQGNFIRNQRHGMGKLFYKDKLVYMGEWKKGKFYGKGIIFYYMNLNIKKIEGNFKNGTLKGHSTITLQSGHKVRAIFNNNKIQQKGMLLPSQKSIHKLSSCKSYQGKIRILSPQEVGDKFIFITNSGQTFNL